MSRDIVDVRDLIERFEELETDLQEEYDEYKEEFEPTDEQPAPVEMAEWGNGNADYEEFENLRGFLEDLAGSGGDHQWRGDWYPTTLIPEHAFKEHAQQLAEDIGAISGSEGWPLNCIDWDEAARELQQDYTSAEWDGVTYYYRS